MTAEFLAGIVGIGLSLVFSYVPGLNAKFAALDATYKRLIMLSLLVLTAGAVYGLACIGWAANLGINLTCDQAGLQELLKALFAAVIANQTAYIISPEPQAVRAAKAARG
jgi:hypothetical protein